MRTFLTALCLLVSTSALAQDQVTLTYHGRLAGRDVVGPGRVFDPAGVTDTTIGVSISGSAKRIRNVSLTGFFIWQTSPIGESWALGVTNTPTATLLNDHASGTVDFTASSFYIWADDGGNPDRFGPGFNLVVTVTFDGGSTLTGRVIVPATPEPLPSSLPPPPPPPTGGVMPEFRFPLAGYADGSAGVAGAFLLSAAYPDATTPAKRLELIFVLFGSDFVIAVTDVPAFGIYTWFDGRVYPPGNYQFKVRAIRSDDSVVTSLPITVKILN